MNKETFSLLSKDDLYLFNEGSHIRLYEKLGSHPASVGGEEGVYFAVWAPNAEQVYVMGDFNNWEKKGFKLKPCGDSGIWEGFIPGLTKGSVYKYFIASRVRRYRAEKADPFASYYEQPSKTASIVWDLAYDWADSTWMKQRKRHNSLDAPISIYELQLGSWMRVPEEDNRSLTYREMAPKLAAYVNQMGFTHVELMPVMEHPFGGSWGYQVTGYFAPTSRYGTPQDFMYLVDYLHQHGIGVLLDWVPSHFPGDMHGLAFFDGTHLFEHADSRKGFHPDWKSYIFNYGRHEVRSFLLSSAIFWLDKYHIDGLRVDGVASMLYLDYSRKNGEWIPNEFGGRENLEAISLLRRLNEEVYKNYPDVQTIAEESTDWAMVSRPTYIGGLGFGMKWDMGWMHDTLDFITRDPIHRKFHHNQLTFRMLYAFTENFVLSLSHDEVVHGKASLLSKMPGDDWQKFANTRLLFSYMFTQPGKKLLFMGDEFGQWQEWDYQTSLDWHLLQYERHQALQRTVRDLAHLYRNEPALHEFDFEWKGFEWVDCNDWQSSILSYLRHGKSTNDQLLIVCNFTPVPRKSYRIGVPRGGFWREIFNSDALEYGGGGQGNQGGLTADCQSCHGRPFTLNVTIPPLGALIFKSE
jgi:1,4-alpha-glucan branching enzyme